MCWYIGMYIYVSALSKCSNVIVSANACITLEYVTFSDSKSHGKYILLRLGTELFVAVKCMPPALMVF